MNDAADQKLAEQLTAGEIMNEIIKQLLSLLIGRMIDEPFGIDDAIQPA